MKPGTIFNLLGAVLLLVGLYMPVAAEAGFSLNMNAVFALSGLLNPIFLMYTYLLLATIVLAIIQAFMKKKGLGMVTLIFAIVCILIFIWWFFTISPQFNLPLILIILGQLSVLVGNIKR